LAIIFWLLYVINEQHGKTVSQVWNGQELMLTFRINVSEALMSMWWELCSLVKGTSLTDEEDQILWSYTSHGTYSVQSLYAVINCRGVVPMFVHAIWKLVIPPRVHFFLWLLSCNRLLTRDNLKKRRDVSDPTCLFCSEQESISHLFFEPWQGVVHMSFTRALTSAVAVGRRGSVESSSPVWSAHPSRWSVGPPKPLSGRC